MRPQLSRLPPHNSGAFSGASIDRARPLRFQLDGREISGFAGDTVLSAALACGIDTLGLYRGQPLGLTPSASPAIVRAGAGEHAAISMASAPAIDNADFLTLGAHRKNPLSRLFLPGKTLGVQLDGQTALIQPWRTIAGTSYDAGDLIVIGGGVAGMEAALAASRKGLTVTLVEVSPELGGHSGLFGTQDGEAPPEAEMARLRTSIEASDAITVFVSANAFAIRPGCVRVQLVDVSRDRPEGRVLDFSARYIVLATGARERLPIFSGNRLPGVMGTLDSYLLAARYGVWPGQSALVATVSNFGYRLTMLASEAGIDVKRILDGRGQASSRFIEFSRAYGMVQTLGAQPKVVGTTKAGAAISVHTERAGAEALLTDRLLVCGGWQPDLTLWHAAGGASQWQAGHHRLVAVGTLDSIALAGSAAGYMTRQGCIASGEDAINLLLNGKRKPVIDSLIDPLYESVDAALPVAAPRDDAAPAFLDSSRTLSTRPALPKRSWADGFRHNHSEEPARLSDAPAALGIGEIVAGVALGLIPAQAAGRIASDRMALIPLVPTAISAQLADRPTPLEIPSYLVGRFGTAAQLVKIIPDHPRQISSGALLYGSPDLTNPLEAIGVVLRDGEDGIITLMAKIAANEGRPIHVRDQGQTVSARFRILDT